MTLIARTHLEIENFKVEGVNDSLKGYLEETQKALLNLISPSKEFMEEGYFDEALYLIGSMLERVSLEQESTERFLNFRDKNLSVLKIKILEIYCLVVKSYLNFLERS